MDETQALTGVAEAAIAMAGFSGVVVVFRRSGDPWLPEDRFRLAVLIVSSLTTAAFAFLPLVLWEIAGAERRVWQVSSASWAIFGIWFIAWGRSRRASLESEDPAIRDRVAPGMFNVVSYGVAPFFVGLSLVNVAFWGAFTPYLAALVWGLVASGIQFARILQSALR